VTGIWGVRKLGDFSDDEHFLSLRPITPFRSLSSLMQEKNYLHIFLALYSASLSLFSVCHRLNMNLCLFFIPSDPKKGGPDKCNLIMCE
jgi:hypothetical protein